MPAEKVSMRERAKAPERWPNGDHHHDALTGTPGKRNRSQDRYANVDAPPSSQPARIGAPAYAGPQLMPRSVDMFGGLLAPRSGTAVVSETRAIPYPHAAQISNALGAPVVGNAVVNETECTRRGVLAFTDASTTHFATGTPSLHVASHEAAHLLQHAGETNDAHLGAEGHAHTVANAVTSGAGARHLLGKDGAPVTATSHNYTYVMPGEQQMTGEYATGHTMMVSHDGRAAVASEDGNNKACYADLALVSSSNKTLKAKKSKIQLAATGASIKGKKGGPAALARIEPIIESDNNFYAGGADQSWWSDCGRSAREVIGPGDKQKPYGVYADASGKQVRTARSATSDPTEFASEILVKSGLGATTEQARAKYSQMTKVARDAFDKKHKINRYAAPGVGEAFTSTADPKKESNYAFHWAGVVVVAGEDRLTLENFVGDADKYDTKDKGWNFSMYGPARNAEQTFADKFRKYLGGPGAQTMTMTAASSDASGQGASTTQQAQTHTPQTKPDS